MVRTGEPSDAVELSGGDNDGPRGAPGRTRAGSHRIPTKHLVAIAVLSTGVALRVAAPAGSCGWCALVACRSRTCASPHGDADPEAEREECQRGGFGNVVNLLRLW
jgi:hypothetical protein